MCGADSVKQGERSGHIISWFTKNRFFFLSLLILKTKSTVEGMNYDPVNFQSLTQQFMYTNLLLTKNSILKRLCPGQSEKEMKFVVAAV